MGGIHANQSLWKGLVVGLIRHRDLVWNKVGSRFRDSGFGVLGNWREPIGVRVWIWDRQVEFWDLGCEADGIEKLYSTRVGGAFG